MLSLPSSTGEADPEGPEPGGATGSGEPLSLVLPEGHLCDVRPALLTSWCPYDDRHCRI